MEKNRDTTTSKIEQLGEIYTYIRMVKGDPSLARHVLAISAGALQPSDVATEIEYHDAIVEDEE